MRPIDADALQELCDRRIQDTWNSGTAPVSWAHAYADFKDDIDSMPTLTPPNEALTLEQLRGMDGEPVYVVPANEYSELGKWCVVSIGDSDDYSCALVPGVEYWSWKYEGYGEQWLAYRRPPEGEDGDATRG